MKNLLKSIRRLIYKLYRYESGFKNAVYGKFKVVYKDGKVSTPMCWKVANDYAQLFNGKVIDNF